MRASGPIQGLSAVQNGLVAKISRLYEKRGQAQRIATIDQESAIKGLALEGRSARRAGRGSGSC